MEVLERLGCEKVFAEKISGKDKDGRPQLQALLEFARTGDVVHVTKLDRLARNARDALEVADHLHARGAGLIIHDFGSMDITTDVGRLVYTVLAAVAEMERTRIRERQSGCVDVLSHIGAVCFWSPVDEIHHRMSNILVSSSGRNCVHN